MTNDLGRSLSRHEGTIMAGGWLWYLGGILLLAGAFGIVSGAFAIVSGSAALAPDTGFPRVVTGFIALGISPLLLIWPVLQWRQSLEIFEGGIYWQRLVFTDQKIPRANLRSVSHITHRSRSGSTIELLITLIDGSEISISGLDRADQAANLIAQLASGGGPAAPPGPAGGWSPPASGGWQPPGGGA
jgi:hypothetical protein